MAAYSRHDTTTNIAATISVRLMALDRENLFEALNRSTLAYFAESHRRASRLIGTPIAYFE